MEPSAMLEAKLQEFYSPTADTNRKRAIEADLIAFKSSPDGWQHCWRFLQSSSPSPYLQWFCGTVLEDVVSRRWHAIGGTQVQDQLRIFLLHYLTDTSRRLEPFVSSKLQKVLVDIGKVGWPQQFPSFLSDVRELCQSPASYSVGLSILAMIGIEFVREDLPLPSKRRSELQAAFTAELPAIVQLLSQLLTHAHEPSPSAPDLAIQSDLASSALRCLGVLVEYPSMAPFLSPDLCANVFRVVQAAVRPNSGEGLTPSGVAAVQVMTEVLNKRLVPKQLEEFVMNVAMQMCVVLQSITDRPGGLEMMEEDLLNGLTEFLTVFLDQHLGRVLALPAFPFKDFIMLLAQFTFKLPNARLLRRAFVPWATLLEHLSETEAGLVALQDSSSLLGAVSSALLRKVLFATNGPALGELDDEVGRSGGGGGNGGMNGKASAEPGTLQAEAALLSLEEEEAPILGAGAELSEQQEVISEGVTLLQSFARLPPCSQDLGEQVLRSLEEALRALESGATAGTANGLARTVMDASTLLSLIMVVVPQSPQQPFWNALELVLTSSRHMNDVRLHARGPSFLRLQCAAMLALKDLSRGLDTAVAASSGENMQAAITEMVRVARAGLDTMVSPAPEALQREAAALLLALTTKLPADLLRSYPAVASLITDVYQIAAPLPLAVQERILQAVSLLIVPNAGRSADDPAVVTAYTNFVSTLVSTLNEMHGRISRGEKLSHDSLLALRRAARLLRALCSLYGQTPKRIKGILYGAVIPGLPAILPCLSSSLSDIGASASSAAAAQSLLGLLLALHSCFGKELGPSFMVDAVGLLVHLFSSPDFRLNLRNQLLSAQAFKHRRATSNTSYSRSVSVFIIASLLRLLRQISADRSSTPSGIIPEICTLVLDKLVPLIQEAPTDLLPLLLRLMASLLSDHWKDFVIITNEGGRQATSSEMQEVLNRMLVVIMMCIQDNSLPPGTVRTALELLQQLDYDVKLFTLPSFRASMGLPFAMAIMELLVAHAHPLLRDDLLSLLRDLTVGVDAQWTWQTFFPAVLMKIEGLSNEQRGALLDAFFKDIDAQSFAKNVGGFLSDVRYVQMMNEGMEGWLR